MIKVREAKQCLKYAILPLGSIISQTTCHDFVFISYLNIHNYTAFKTEIFIHSNSFKVRVSVTSILFIKRRNVENLCYIK